MATILIADDDISIREFLIRSLMKANPEYRLLSCVNGLQALKIVAEARPDLILLDWEMPKLNGIETIKRLKTYPETADIPVIMCTGVMTDLQSLGHAFEAGVMDFLRKPVDEAELVARVNAMLMYRQLLEDKMQLEIEKHELMLHHKQQEVTNYVLQLTQKNSFLVKIREDLTAFSEKAQATGLQAVIASIDFNMENDTWTELNKMVSSVEPGFLDRLISGYPDLTAYDIRFCSLVRLKLSTKEMAQLLNISGDSITKSRYRLKKKMMPDSDVTFEQIIFKI